MRKESGWLVKALGCVPRALLGVSGIMILLMAFAATYAVARRYLMRDPEPYSYEIGMMLLLWCFVLSVAELQNQERHLRGDFILSRLPRSCQFFVNRLLSPVLAALCGMVLAWKGWEAALFSLRIGERSISSWSEPLFPVKVLIPVGYGILFIVAMTQFFRGIIFFINKFDEEGTEESVARRPDREPLS